MARTSADRMAALWAPSGAFADDEATQLALTHLGMAPAVVDLLAASMPGGDNFMELNGRNGTAAFRRNELGKWTAAP
jgi:hypothetical protein